MRRIQQFRANLRKPEPIDLIAVAPPLVIGTGLILFALWVKSS